MLNQTICYTCQRQLIMRVKSADFVKSTWVQILVLPVIWETLVVMINFICQFAWPWDTKIKCFSGCVCDSGFQMRLGFESMDSENCSPSVTGQHPICWEPEKEQKMEEEGICPLFFCLTDELEHPMSSSLDLTWYLYYGFPWFSGLWTWTEL